APVPASVRLASSAFSAGPKRHATAAHAGISVLSYPPTCARPIHAAASIPATVHASNHPPAARRAATTRSRGAHRLARISRQNPIAAARFHAWPARSSNTYHEYQPSLVASIATVLAPTRRASAPVNTSASRTLLLSRASRRSRALRRAMATATKGAIASAVCLLK